MFVSVFLKFVSFKRMSVKASLVRPRSVLEGTTEPPPPPFFSSSFLL